LAFLSKKELEALLPKQIDPFRPERIKDVAYELSLGNQVYQTDSKSEKKEILDDKNSQIVIKPGQFALLLTEEKVTVPLVNIAFISIKFKEKIKGLVNVSGFHVDPGFSGRIIFSVYNAGPADIVMDKGKPYFLIWFSELTSAANKYEGNHQGQDEITADHVAALKGEIASPNVLLEKIKNLQIELNDKIRVVDGKKDRNDWLLKTIVGLAIVIGLKVIWDFSQYSKGYVEGYGDRDKKAQIDSTVEKLQLENKMILHKFDSVLNIKMKPDSAKKH